MDLSTDVGFMHGRVAVSRGEKRSIEPSLLKFSFNRSWLIGAFRYLCSPFLAPEVA